MDWTNIIVGICTIITTVISIKVFTKKATKEQVNYVLDIANANNRIALLEQKVDINNSAFCEDLREIKENVKAISEHFMKEKK